MRIVSWSPGILPSVAFDRHAAKTPSERSIRKKRMPVGLLKVGVISVPLGGKTTSMTSSTPSFESISAARSGVAASERSVGASHLRK